MKIKPLTWDGGTFDDSGLTIYKATGLMGTVYSVERSGRTGNVFAMIVLPHVGEGTRDEGYHRGGFTQIEAAIDWCERCHQQAVRDVIEKFVETGVA